MATARNTELERAIVDNPESPDVYLVYGDWLLEQGDPLGDLVAVQAALAKAKGRGTAALKKQEKALLAAHTRSLGAFAELDHTWSFGFLEGITLGHPTRARYRELRELVAARFLRELDIELFEPWDAANTNHEMIEMLAELGVPPTLRKLAFLDDDDDPRAALGDVSVLWPVLARVRELTVRAASLSLGRIDLPALETFSLTTRVEAGILDSIVDAAWPKLRSLSLSFAGADAATLDVDAVAKVIESTEPLEHLGLADHFVGDDVVDAIATWKHLPALKSLDLSRTALTDDGARKLLEWRPSFEHLESIDLRENELGSTACKALENAFELAVDVDAQGERMRYDEIAE